MLLSAEQVTKLYGDRSCWTGYRFRWTGAIKWESSGSTAQENPRSCACWREQKSRTAEQSSGNQTYAWSI